MKPRIYSFCDAGCKWEAVHKADFDRSASIVRETPDANGTYKLDPFKVYKVKTGSFKGKYNATIHLAGAFGTQTISYDEFDEYRDYIIFEILSVTRTTPNRPFFIVYEINGNRYSDSLGDGNITDLDLSTLELQISGAEEVFAYNVNAEILAETQQVYETAEESEGDECPDTLPDYELYTVPAEMYAGQRTAKVGDLVLYRYLVSNASGQNIILCKITSVDNHGVNLRAVCFVQGAGNGEYAVEDATARNEISVLKTRIKNVEDNSLGKLNDKHNTLSLSAYPISQTGITMYYTEDYCKKEDTTHTILAHTETVVKLPLVAGENVELVKDEEKNVVKINATGGGGSGLEDITHLELKTLRDNGQLVAGQQYRITDYVATTTQENTQSAGHPFDIIVVADSPNTLNENARAVAHEGDTYFANCKLSAWEIKYSLDNDKSRFWWAREYAPATVAWFTSGYDNGVWRATGETYEHEGKTYYVFYNEEADSTFYSAVPAPTAANSNEVYIDFEGSGTLEDDGSPINNSGDGREVPEGRGVIYYMKDEYDNECPYDFKNIQFKRWATDDEVANDDKFYSSLEDTGNALRWCYTFTANGYTNDTWADASIIKPYKLMSDEGGKSCSGNIIKPFYSYYDNAEESNEKDGVQWLNDIVLYGGYEDNLSYDGYSYNYINLPAQNEFGLCCREMTCGKDYASNFNTIGADCRRIKIGGFTHDNTIGNKCGEIAIYGSNNTVYPETNNEDIQGDNNIVFSSRPNVNLGNEGWLTGYGNGQITLTEAGTYIFEDEGRLYFAYWDGKSRSSSTAQVVDIGGGFELGYTVVLHTGTVWVRHFSLDGTSKSQDRLIRYRKTTLL